MLTYSSLGHFGRLGNQMWQIASTIGIAKKNNLNYCFPHWDYQDYFAHRLPENYPNSLNRVTEKSSAYSPITLDDNTNWDLYGYFQSYKYFEHCQEDIRYFFEPLEGYNCMGGTAIHVRRGDYLSLSHIHLNLTMSYYERAMNLFPYNEQFVVFSDDIAWCMQNFPHGNNIVFGHNVSDIRDLFTMMTCKNFIIANSSYSWWGAYLGSHPEKRVIHPSRWVTNEPQEVMLDRIPKGWEGLGV